MQFQSSNIAFGRNETFGLRYAIPKGYEAYKSDTSIFSDESLWKKYGVMRYKLMELLILKEE